MSSSQNRCEATQVWLTAAPPTPGRAFHHTKRLLRVTSWLIGRKGWSTPFLGSQLLCRMIELNSENFTQPYHSMGSADWTKYPLLCNSFLQCPQGSQDLSQVLSRHTHPFIYLFIFWAFHSAQIVTAIIFKCLLCYSTMLSILHLHYFICSIQHPDEVGAIIIFILQMKTLRHREIKWIAPKHSAGKAAEPLSAPWSVSLRSVTSKDHGVSTTSPSEGWSRTHGLGAYHSLY